MGGGVPCTAAPFSVVVVAAVCAEPSSPEATKHALACHPPGTCAKERCHAQPHGTDATAPPAGLEPATFGLEVRTLSIRPRGLFVSSTRITQHCSFPSGT